jgi:diguanylate cyclase (GGDEF)-like protein/PAS domain S-box-containing protein
VELLGYTHREWLSYPDMWLSVLHPDDRDRIVAETEAAIASGSPVEYDYRVITKSGTVRWMHDRGEFVRDAAGELIAWRGVMIDITDRRLLEDRLASLSEQDELTGLLNRRGFRRVAEQALRMGQRSRRRVGLVYIDLDDFKPINDRHGHAVGDLALQQVASVLRDGVRDGDVVARLGGDEFIILATDLARPGESERLGSRLQKHLENLPHGIPGLADRRITFSFGCAEEDASSSLDDLLARADAVLRTAKARRRAAVR